MSDRPTADGPRAVPLPPDTERDTRLLYLFRPAALPWVLGVLLWGVVFMVIPMPWPAKLAFGVVLPGGILGALAVDAPERLARLRRYRRDGPERYAGQATPGNVCALYPNEGTLGVVLDVLAPPWTGRGGAELDAEREAWVHAARRFKSGRASAAVSVAMVADSPPRPGWEVPADLPLAPGYGRFAEQRKRHFEALVREGRAMRPRTLLRLAVSNGAVAGADPELHLDRVTNGVAGELQAAGVLAVPLDLGLLREMAAGTEGDHAHQDAQGPSPTGAALLVAGEPAAGPQSQPPAGSAVPVSDSTTAQAAPPTIPSVPRRVIRLPKLPAFSVAMPRLRRPLLAARASEAGRALAATAAGSEEGSPGWPDLDALAADAGRTWDVGLAVFGALPRVGASSALLGWAAQRPDRSSVVLVDANLERAGGLWLACGQGVPPEGPGWLEPGEPACRAVAPCGAAVIGQGAREDGVGDAPFAAGRLMAAVSGPLRRAGGAATVIALDLGSPPPLTDHLRAHPLVELAARESAAVAVVTRQDAAAIYAAYRLLNTLRACGAVEVRVWVAAYDTADPLTLAEMRATLGVPVEEAPPPPGRRWDGTGAGAHGAALLAAPSIKG